VVVVRSWAAYNLSASFALVHDRVAQRLGGEV
jgi:hypothetical protein